MIKKLYDKIIKKIFAKDLKEEVSDWSYDYWNDLYNYFLGANKDD